jgi:uncharacterized membrane protein
MSLKTYKNWRTVITVMIAAIAAVSVTIGNVYVLVSAVVIGMIILFLLRRIVKGVVRDERTYAIAYKASRLTMSVVGVGMAIVGAILLALSQKDFSSSLAQAGFALEYAVCALLVINLAAYTYYSRKLGGGE